MRQNYYCPNCGTPVNCGDSFCMGCGIKFNWIEQPGPARQEHISYKLSPPDQQGISPQERPLLDQHSQASALAQPGPNDVAEKNSAQSGGASTPLSAGISRLLESFFDKHAGCSKS
jgi:hypothetical protein